MKELMNIQAELHAPKNQRNTFGGYNYRSAEDILEAVKPLLKKEGCTLVLSDEIWTYGADTATMTDNGITPSISRYYVKATATLTNAKGESVSASAYAREPQSKKGADESQITGAASSYARKYALNGLFAIDDNKDADAEQTLGTLIDLITNVTSREDFEKAYRSIDKEMREHPLIDGALKFMATKYPKKA